MTAEREYDPASAETDVQTTDVYPDKQKRIPASGGLFFHPSERQDFLLHNESGYEKQNHPQPRTERYDTTVSDIAHS